ncbi:ribbon-helix-helix domain-containing protein [Phaeobacter sp. JH20_32]|uniref:ribbon-helix-helix domain-containing protein n=1 Tax=Phaeobacter sp. JH20_32 TaxID=3112489 RepID=UPI003A897918
MSKNSLSAAIAGNLAEQETKSPAPAPEAIALQSEPKGRARKSKPRETVLVGGHFPPAVLKQLRIIAAEEGTTNQALLEEALNLLFVKKGKVKIESL